jgi:hypothetical protein
MSEFKAGDEVLVFINRRHVHTPEGGWPGTVTKVSRKYAIAEYDYEYTSIGRSVTDRRSVEFDMTNGHERGDASSYGIRVRTPGQVAQDQRRRTALAALKAAGIEFRPGREYTLTLEQAEALAEVVKGWDR